MKNISLKIRSLIFNISFIFITIAMSLYALLAFFLPQICMLKIAKIWSKCSLYLLKKICHIDYIIKGKENLPKNQTFIIASKHQSAWETIAFQSFFYPTVYIFKKELLYIPAFGIALLAAKNIPVTRGQGSKKVIQDLIEKFKNRLKKTNVIIFPEGTRTLPKANPEYKAGISLIAKNLDTTIVPIAMNSGSFWCKKSFIKKPGTIQVHILKPIQTKNLSVKEIQEKIQNSIENKMKEIE